MRYFIDTEFIEDGKTIDLISVGIVAQDGREFYCLNLDCDHSLANDWVKANVLAYLPSKQPQNISRSSEDLQGKYTSHKRIGLEILAKSTASLNFGDITLITTGLCSVSCSAP